ncbi:hypothetical protein BaRGS_00016568 [Batillaria attramentaria]|uniref:Uncharacterized protein n=1 Tax=Batillaria attramentaria TaxID=370345 RepID=A0ABD0KYV2_9CAEN
MWTVSPCRCGSHEQRVEQVSSRRSAIIPSQTVGACGFTESAAITISACGVVCCWVSLVGACQCERVAETEIKYSSRDPQGAEASKKNHDDICIDHPPPSLPLPPNCFEITFALISPGRGSRNYLDDPHSGFVKTTEYIIDGI